MGRTISDLDELLQITSTSTLAAQHGPSVEEVVLHNAGARLAHLPPLLFQFSCMKRLDLSSAAVTSIPFSISSLVQLQVGSGLTGT